MSSSALQTVAKTNQPTSVVERSSVRAHRAIMRTQQHAPGNQTMQQLLRSRAIQARLTVDTPGDEHEHEADTVTPGTNPLGSGPLRTSWLTPLNDANLIQRQTQPSSGPAAAAAQQPPPLSIQGQPHADATPSGEQANSPNAVHMVLGRFSITAAVRAQSAQASAFDDWEAGIVQMVSGPIDTRCYRRPRPVAGQTQASQFVDRLEPRPGPFFPDREPGSQIFASATAMQDLAQLHGGRLDFQFTLRTTDSPNASLFGFASALTGDFNDTDVELYRYLRAGTFYTYVTARQKSTNQLFPLYATRWWMAADYNFVSPGSGIDFTSRPGSRLFFRLIDGHLFSSADFFPVVNGIPMNEWSRTHRQRDWGTECPGFIQ